MTRKFSIPDTHPNFPVIEQEILGYWQENNIFQKSLVQREDNEKFVFYEGPPFATGLPHYGHLITSIAKDIVPRYQTMRGRYVERRWGWDCHGLPIENIAEKSLKVTTKKEIEGQVGIDKFNAECERQILEYADEWRRIIDRFGRWVDWTQTYLTMDFKYTESVWWAFRQLWDKGRVYEGRRVVPYCYRCETPLAISETRADDATRPRKDPTLTVGFSAKYTKTGRGIGLIIVNNDDEILLIYRNEDHREKTWAMPGGKVETGETFEEAVHRECLEELGVDCEILELTTLQPDIFEGRLFLGAQYVVRLKGEPHNNAPTEIAEIKWWPLSKLPEMSYRPSITAIENYKAGKKAIYADLGAKKELPKVSLLAWTTTPWTLPANQLLAVSPLENYVILKKEEEFFVLMEKLVDKYFDREEIEIASVFPAQDLIDLKYEPLFDFFQDKVSENSYKISVADFVGAEEGTGIVHCAEFGEDDFRVFEKMGIEPLDPVDEVGVFKKGLGFLSGQNILAAADDIIADLKKRGLLFRKETLEHNYPHCWRCDTPLMYRPLRVWFIKVEDAHERMLELNEEITWVPENIKHNRFGKWLEGSRDWLISRNRYWGAPMPVWKCHGKSKVNPSGRLRTGSQKLKDQKKISDEGCGNVFVPGSFLELEEKMVARNRWYAIRHGEGEHNAGSVVVGAGTDPKDDCYELTKKGEKEVEEAITTIKKMGITRIFASTMRRTRQTAEMIQKALGGDIEVVFDDRLREIDYGDFEGGADGVGTEFRTFYAEKWTQNPDTNFPGGESQNDARDRVYEFFKEQDKKLQGEKILIVGHMGSIRALFEGIYDLRWNDIKAAFGPRTGEFLDVYPKITKVLDSHRPAIDEHEWPCEKCGGTMRRIPEVMDCWFESGVMPFAQHHYPFENKKKFEEESPADFAVEYVGQVRTWFYYMHVISAALFDKPPFYNVIAHGVVQGSDGRKMSKRLKNYPDVEQSLLDYGADAMRFALTATPILSGEDAAVKEELFAEARNKVLRPLWSSYCFFATYAPENFEPAAVDFRPRAKLDRWILSVWSETLADMTAAVDRYDLQGAARLIPDFLDALTNWYIRRSRERFSREIDMEAFQTLYRVLADFCKSLAPFVPFISDKIYRELTGKESVHLDDWPIGGVVDEGLNEEVAGLRRVVKLGHGVRAAENIKVRQPLALAQITGLTMSEEDKQVLMEELNVEKLEIVEDAALVAEMFVMPDARVLGPRLGSRLQEIIKLAKAGEFTVDEDGAIEVGEEVLRPGEFEIRWRAKEGFSVAAEKGIVVALDTKITNELKERGLAREVIRGIQDARKEAGLKLGEIAEVGLLMPSAELGIVTEYLEEIMDKTNSRISVAEGEMKIEVKKA